MLVAFFRILNIIHRNKFLKSLLNKELQCFELIEIAAKVSEPEHFC